MLVNVSYNNPEITRQINLAVGKPLGFWQRIRLGGSGSQKFVISSATEGFQRWLGYNQDPVFCNLEIRPNGLVLRFRYLLETIAWVLPAQDVAWQQHGLLLEVTLGCERLELQPAWNNTLDTDFFSKARSVWQTMRVAG